MNSSKHIIFHHPQRIVSDGMAGSAVRPFRMLEAFRQLGYEVEVVEGSIFERQQAIEKIKQHVAKGRVFDFVYAESTSQPTALSGGGHFRNHMRKHLLVDWGFFYWLKQRSVFRSLYYRDIYWQFPVYREVTTRRRRMVAVPLYWYDWINYYWLVDHLFLPSLAMTKVLPTPYPAGRVSALPPGCIIPVASQLRLPRSEHDRLELFYVGGVKPPLYDLKPLFEVVKSLDNVFFTVCCRVREWEQIASYYAPVTSPNIRIVHDQGEALNAHYARTDLFMLVRSPDSYLDFAMPIKVFESLGQGVPIVAIDGTEAARFVQREDIGWMVATTDELRQLLIHLHAHPQQIHNKRQQMQSTRERHTWKARAQTVVDTMHWHRDMHQHSSRRER
jgi:glycosyltransferase involved in cell wall biosynthesis